MDFINKIGQRNCAKLLVILAFCICYILFALHGTRDLKNVAIGLLLFSFPNVLFSFSAHKSKDYRLLSLIISTVSLLLNTTLFFYLNRMTLFILTFAIFIEIIVGVVLYLYIAKLEKKKKLEYRNKKRRVRMGESQTKELSKEFTVDKDTVVEEKE